MVHQQKITMDSAEIRDEINKTFIETVTKIILDGDFCPTVGKMLGEKYLRLIDYYKDANNLDPNEAKISSVGMLVSGVNFIRDVGKIEDIGFEALVKTTKEHIEDVDSQDSLNAKLSDVRMSAELAYMFKD